jgi:hypothetical protein
MKSSNAPNTNHSKLHAFDSYCVGFIFCRDLIHQTHLVYYIGLFYILQVLDS